MRPDDDEGMMTHACHSNGRHGDMCPDAHHAFCPSSFHIDIHQTADLFHCPSRCHDRDITCSPPGHHQADGPRLNSRLFHACLSASSTRTYSVHTQRGRYATSFHNGQPSTHPHPDTQSTCSTPSRPLVATQAPSQREPAALSPLHPQLDRRVADTRSQGSRSLCRPGA